VQIKLSARHGHLHDDTAAYLRQKAEKLPHFFNRLTSIEVMVDLQGDEKLVELMVSAEHKHDFVAREGHADVRAAMDLALDKMEAQLRKYKERVMDHRRTPARGDGQDRPASEEPQTSV
jgi:putative sigma-54 modulation protein